MYEIRLDNLNKGCVSLALTDKPSPIKPRKKRIVALGQWIFDVDCSCIAWEPLSAALSNTGLVILYPVRKSDLELKLNAYMYTIIGVKNMKHLVHYIAIEGSGLTNLGWQLKVINKEYLTKSRRKK